MRSLDLMLLGCAMAGLSSMFAVAQEPTPLPEDLNIDGIVDYEDLFLFQESWQVDRRPLVTVALPGDVTMEFVRIAGGNFEMGSADDADWSHCHPCEQPAHPVDIGYDFYIGRCEVTQAQWEALMGTNPAADFGVGDDYPVYNISWEDCQSFIAQLNNLGQGAFRLPSEAEWEYACRAGTTTRFSFGDSICSPTDVVACELDNYGWWSNNSTAGTEPVGRLLPNAWGLYDMHGNVNEWCEDDWHDAYSGAPADGSAWVDVPRAANRVLRGGYWDYIAGNCRSAFRLQGTAEGHWPEAGMRLVRVAR